ncbi:MAG: GGDEF domain-containing protein [Lachnospiraceae bacterium]|nr:GGDEF domain-containing protein [Lachnospiraceae bacterium]
MTGKIAVFIGQLNQEYLMEMIISVVDAAKELNYQIDVFTEFGSYGGNYLHAEGERNIIRLPFVEDYDGIVVAPDTFGVKDMEKQLDMLLLAKTKSPVVSIRQEKDCFYNVQIDNRATMATLTEHFVKDHGYKKVCFMKGRADLKDAQERLQGYLEVMEKYQLPVTERMLFQGNYWRNLGDAAVEWFLGGEEKPEAIICANDFMAISVLMALKKRNIKVPEEIALAGFDDIEEVRYLEPAVCSMHMPCYEMGRESVHLIDRLVHGGKSEQMVRLPATLVPRKSCGCDVEERGHWAELLYGERRYLGEVIMFNGFMNADYENCDTSEELFNIAFQYTSHFDFDEIYIYLCETTDENGDKIIDAQHYTDHMILRAVMLKDQSVTMMDERFPRRELLPKKYRQDTSALYFFPMHHKNHCLGYLALKANYVTGLKDFFTCWVSEMCSCLDKVLLYEENKSLQEFRKLSTIDDLTGLYNRRKLESELSKILVNGKTKDGSFHIVSLDMDGLKTINDTYGHLEGDAALQAFAEVIRDATGEHGMSFRVGGDEFTILLPTGEQEVIDQVIAGVDHGIEAYNQRSGKPYDLAGSRGYAKYIKDEEISNCLRRADIDMYANKMARKQGRR